MARPCRHCGSPARFNPCWYALENPEYATGGGDPPCIEEMWVEESMSRERKFNRNIRAIGLGAAAMLIALIWYGVR
jgi:hypothetical protein